MRALAYLLIFLATALGPLSAAVRAEPGGPGSLIVLCSDQGAVAVPAGPDGAPLDDSSPAPMLRHCDDCLPLPQPAACAPPLAAAAAPLTLAHPLWIDRTVAQPSARAVPTPSARGPPMVT